MKSKLDAAANCAIIVLCIVAIAALAKSQLMVDDRPVGLAVEIGDVLKPLRTFLPQDVDRTLLVALNPDCGFCTESIPFYKKLGENRALNVAELGFVAAVASDEDLQRQQEILRRADLTFDSLVVLDFQSLRLLATPTILLVDGRGRVLNAWVGRLTTDAEQEVLEALGRDA